MRPYLIVMSHGEMAAETVNSAKMIVGEIENIAVISMLADDGLSGTTEKLTQVLNELDAEQQILILADLKGGTPCNVAMMKMAEYPNLQVVTGFNLAMLLEGVFSPATTATDLAQQLVGVGKTAVEKIVIPAQSTGDDDDIELE